MKRISTIKVILLVVLPLARSAASAFFSILLLLVVIMSVSVAASRRFAAGRAELFARRTTTLLCFLAIGVCVPSNATQAAELRYRIVDLGPLPSGLQTFAYGINDLGDVVGSSIGASNGNIAHSRPVVWSQGRAASLLWEGSDGHCEFDPVLDEFVCEEPVFPGARPWAINNDGTIVGQAQNNGYTGTPLPVVIGIPDGTAFIWDAMRGRRSLGTLGGSNSEARAINHAGLVVGSAHAFREVDFGEGSVLRDVSRAFVWDEIHGMQELDSLGSESDYSLGADINNRGEVVGRAMLPSGREVAFIWDADRGMREIPTPVGFLSGGLATAINDSGQVIGGFSSWPQIGGAFIWDEIAGFRPPVDESGFRMIHAFDINEYGYVIGVGRPANEPSADYMVIWHPESGMRLLSDLIDNGSAWSELEATAINERNEIVGFGRFGEQVRAYRMVPVPEPSTILLVVIMSVSVAALRRFAAGRAMLFARRTTTLLCFLAIGVCAGSNATQAAELRYRIVDLGPLPGGLQTFAYGINDLSQVVGGSIGESNGNIAHSRPVVWSSGGVPSQLWPEAPGARPRAINNAGVIVGQAQNSGYTGTPLPNIGGIPSGTAFIWDAVDGRRSLGTLGGSNSEARAINEFGVVAGSADVRRVFDFGNGPVTLNVPRAFVWDEVNGMRDLGTFGTDQDFSRGMDVNNLGQVVGWSSLPDGRELAFVWDEQTGMRELPGVGSSRALSINNAGYILGHDDRGAVMWDTLGNDHYLGIFPGAGLTSGWFMNDRGEVVGGDSSEADFRLFIWNAGEGIGSLTDSVVDLPGWNELELRAINNQGQITGFGRIDDDVHAFLMTPVPEPGACSLLLVLIAFGLVSRGLKGLRRFRHPSSFT